MTALRTIILAALTTCPVLLFARSSDSTGHVDRAIIEPFPIISYDTDAGFGYGVKAIFRNQFGFRESFDITAFNSTEGERWYRLAISLPDAELRHGSVFPLALDLVIDYDKWISNSYFGVGNGSRYENREYYTKEPLDFSLALSRGFSPVFVGQLGVRFRAVRNFGLSPESRMTTQQPGVSDGRASYTSVFGTLRYDSRNSTVHPTSGVVAQAELEHAPEGWPGNVALIRYGLTLQGYVPVLQDDIVAAGRIVGQSLDGDHLPVQVMLPIGGNGTLRGSVQDRYLDRTAVIVNAELRFHIYRRLACVAGLDAGKVWRSPRAMSLLGWATNPTAGLRFIMQTFVVRLDVGFGRESTGVYFNFGQLF